MLVTDPFYASRDTSAQALAVEMSHAASLSYGLREDEGYSEAFFTGTVDEARQALEDLDASGIPVELVEVNGRQERESLADLCLEIQGGSLEGGATVSFEPCALEIVGEFRTPQLHETMTPDG